jgi:hypothetical protein
MTSYQQIQANRRNALKSTGPKTEAGKHSSRCNAVRHGLTAETVIGALEDAEDYKAFEAAITADYDAQSAVERELVLRLASILWRLRRATTMETGLFEIQAGHLRDYRQHRELLLSSRDVIHAVFRRPDSSNAAAISHSAANKMETVSGSGKNADSPAVEFARCFLRLANYPISRSIALAAMKRPFGVKPVGCCMRSKNWTAVNRRSGRVVFGSERGSENSTKSHHDEVG